MTCLRVDRSRVAKPCALVRVGKDEAEETGQGDERDKNEKDFNFEG